MVTPLFAVAWLHSRLRLEWTRGRGWVWTEGGPTPDPTTQARDVVWVSRDAEFSSVFSIHRQYIPDAVMRFLPHDVYTYIDG